MGRANNREDYINKTFKTNEGYDITILRFIDSLNVEVSFEDGYKRTTRLSSVKIGSVKYNNYDNYIGKIFITNEGHEIKIVAYTSPTSIEIEFEDGYRRTTQLGSIKSGTVKYNNYTGKIFTTNTGNKLKIIKYINCTNVRVESDNGTKETVTLTKLRSGKFKQLLHGVGYSSKGRFVSSKNKQSTKEYRVWHNIMSKCYKTTEAKCRVANDWHNFQSFCIWYADNIYESNSGADIKLDKDIILKNNTLYSSQTCLLVPKELTHLISTSKVKNENCPQGVWKIKNKYKASITREGERIHLGAFDTPEEAFKNYKEAKESHIKEKTQDFWISLSEETKQREMPRRVYEALMNYTIDDYEEIVKICG